MSASTSFLTPFCGELRSKKFLTLDVIPSQADEYFDRSGHCWCYHTQKPLGPDGELVGPHECNVGRSCYRSALSPFSG